MLRISEPESLAESDDGEWPVGRQIRKEEVDAPIVLSFHSSLSHTLIQSTQSCKVSLCRYC